MKIAIVGSEDKYWSHTQKAKAVLKIKELLDNISLHVGTINMVMVSGGCPKGGVDIWAEVIADSEDIKKEIHYPEVNQWNDAVWVVDEGDDKFTNYRLQGYNSRNQNIAMSCDVLYCIDPKDRTHSGGRYTMVVAKELGKEVHLVEIE